MFIYLYIYVFIYLYIYVFIYLYLGGWTDKDTDASHIKSSYLLLNCAFDTCETAKYYDR